MALADWLSNMKESSSLKKLNLANAKISASHIIRPMLGLRCLELLDLSYTKIGEFADVQHLCSLAEITVCLSNWNLSYCSLTGKLAGD